MTTVDSATAMRATDPVPVAGRPLVEALVVGGVGFAFYLATLAPTFGWGDTSELATTAYRLDLGHGPGYPFYILLGKLFTLAPVGSVAVRLNAMSALWAAVAVALVYLLGRRLGGSRRTGLLAALGAAFGNTWWQYATRAEVYSLHLALLAGALLAVLAWRDGGRIGHLRLAAVLAGLGLAHQPMMLLAAPALLILAWTGRQRPTWAQVGQAVLAAVALGGAAYLYVALRSPGHPAGTGPTPLGRLVAVATGLGPGSPAFVTSWHDIALRAVDQWHRLPTEVGVVVPVFALVGFWGWRRQRGLLAGLGVLGVGSAAFALAYRLVDPGAYYLPAFLTLCLAAAAGMGAFLRYLRAQAAWLHWPIGMALLLVAASSAPDCVRLHREEPVRAAEAFARGAFQVMPAGSLVLADRWCAGPLRYLQLVEGQRRDLTIRPVLSAGNAICAAATAPAVLSRYPAVYLADVLTGKPALLRRRYPIAGSGPLFEVIVHPRPPVWRAPGPCTARFGRLGLHGAKLSAGRVAPGRLVWLTLAWAGPPAPGTEAVVSLVGPAGRVWADRAPIAGAWPARQWRAGRAAMEQRPIFVPCDCPPGRYKVELAVRGRAEQAVGGPATLATLEVGTARYTSRQ